MVEIPNNIFVLCTGRCGSTTLARACAHFDNYTCEHEGRSHLTGTARFDFPQRHIEIDNRLSWLLGRLDRHWGDAAFYVHLTRDREAVAQSFAKRAGQGILKAYRHDILMKAPRLSADTPLIDFCRDYVDTVTENIHLFLRDKTHVMGMTLETLGPDFLQFCDRIGATGDLDAARTTLSQRHNPSRHS